MTSRSHALFSRRRLATRLGLGQVAVHVYHKPLGLARRTVLEGGPIEQWRTRAGRRAMREATELLPELRPPSGRYQVPVSILSGEKFWYQTVFCIASLQHHVDKRVDPVIFDDGTLSADARDGIRRVVPWVRFVPREDVSARLEERLPSSRYPMLRSRRAEYPHLRKLTDIHDPTAFSLALDSDILFFRRPVELLSWMEAPSEVLALEEARRSYGYSDELMNDLSRGQLPYRMNVGLYGLHGSIIDFDYLEHCCREQMTREGANYLQEQSLTALLVSGRTIHTLPRKHYVVLPDIVEGRRLTAAMHHYVAQSKRSYFQHGWRIVLAELARAVVR